jgi:hypothetical protein
MGEKTNASMFLVGKPHGKENYTWEHNFIMDRREMGWVGMDWIYLV